jgi:drug/metabolite transporter (DMT)-like permease
MIYLVLAVSCSLTIGMIFKHAGRHGIHRLELLTANYLAGTALSILLLLMRDGSIAIDPSGGVVVLGIVTGALFIAGFFLLSLATEMAGMGLAIGVMRVSVVVPFLASWWIWGEVPSPSQGVGLILAGLAFFLIASGRPSQAPSLSEKPAAPQLAVFIVLAAVFVVGGVIDTLLKAFEESHGPTTDSAVFLGVVFAIAFAIGLAIRLPGYLLRKQRIDVRALGWGVLLGAVNYGSAAFLLAAIGQLSGPFVFPANNIAIVIGAAVLGVVFWGERLSRSNIIGLGLAALALVLLNF